MFRRVQSHHRGPQIPYCNCSLWLRVGVVLCLPCGPTLRPAASCPSICFPEHDHRVTAGACTSITGRNWTPNSSWSATLILGQRRGEALNPSVFSNLFHFSSKAEKPCLQIPSDSFSWLFRTKRRPEKIEFIVSLTSILLPH